MEKARQYSALVAVTVLAACQPAPVEKTDASPAPAQEKPLSWGFGAESNGRAHLAHGPDESDNITVGFVCIPGSATVGIDVALNGDKATLFSGDTQQSYAIKVPDSEFAWLSSGKMRTSDPVLRAFLKTGQLEIQGDGEWFAVPVKTPAERAALDSFVKACQIAL